MGWGSTPLLSSSYFYLCVAQLGERKFGELEAVGSRPITETTFGFVAQLVEQRIENPCVTGSIPVRATRNKSTRCSSMDRTILS